MQKIILASTSPRRKELLKQIGLEFEAVSSDYEEDMTLDMKPKDLAKYLSNGKAVAVAHQYQEGIIIAADTFVVLKDRLLGKPHTASMAKKMLRQIGGKQVSIITGLTVLDVKNKKKISRVVEAKLFIKKLNDKEINNYIKSGEPLDKAGAFAVQGLGAVLIRKIEGDYSGIVGLPLFELATILRKMGVMVL
jgi:septum formation protein